MLSITPIPVATAMEPHNPTGMLRIRASHPRHHKGEPSELPPGAPPDEYTLKSTYAMIVMTYVMTKKARGSKNRP